MILQFVRTWDSLTVWAVSELSYQKVTLNSPEQSFKLRSLPIRQFLIKVSELIFWEQRNAELMGPSLHTQLQLE